MEEKVVYIVGLGLIGASLAMGIRKAHPEVTLLGYNRSQASRDIALKNRIVDQVTANLEEFASKADVIIVSLPVKQTMQTFQQLSKMPLKEGVIVTDVGSTKGAIVKAGQEAFKHLPVRFVGGHPMAGSHKTGAASADSTLFENAYYIFTPTLATDPSAILEMKDLLSGLGARFIEVDPIEHDRVTSQISHFPHVLAATLMGQAAAYTEDHSLAGRFAAGGFRDMTRIAESEPSMWTSILLSNTNSVLDRIADFQHRLDQVADMIRQGQEDAIWSFFDRSREQRQHMQIHKRGGVESTFDIFVDVPDEEDVILRILELLRGTSLVNIHINEENREDVYGILQISFKTAADQARAEALITEQTDYSVVIK
ncbi:prephenate dehydrogenase [Streptococcus australis]|uniref:prephenate dehydrogenase n=1 Tax=Streptococcus australis TaxID=113107 RepID=UPI000F672D62|nr:prephenate dehydrogenase [Streptococcus australis]RSJ96449.1 prephenate dehydrogenase [Streptococcus australis]